ncbi:MAG: hypothetical protein IPG59_05490 [Candidatus Melainabacteria bacterium]|nr:MAG: hypothetical protein IPG59_05490 [Candidatus Melainabacteria bacterium]
MNSISFGKSIYLGLGPAIYLGMWLLFTSRTEGFSREGISGFLFSCIGLSALSLVLSFSTLKAHEYFNVPVMKRNGVFDFHKRFVWFYALVVGLPANLLGLYNTLMFSIHPGPITFSYGDAIFGYAWGWLFGATFGTILGYICLAFLVPTLTGLIRYAALRGTACKTVDPRELTTR